ncbi:hypothetical protein HN51_061884 [Arachis hypogaea]|uniref:B3 domain-containing protein Os01g0234100-like isoform X1 n=2 Tax=Arachis ipaensis TaxID=130454 RepID=UPI000A2B937C|nr:B3 domain-containing protein Os01g0234100-like isoform X1 [Arachis ipaensis]XP_025627203.1 B3 domain-containing protein Os01g0234100-like [Arachis hypogaea]QHO19252.1 B3 domain-containing protein [Arachis hypogaea]
MVDRMVKKEVEQHDEQTVTLGFYGDEQAQRRFSINMMDKQNKATDNKNKVLNSDIKPVTNGEAQKFASSMKGTTAEATSSRGEAKSSAVIRAEEIRSSLQAEYPSFVKSLVRSHVASCFWMGLPVAFCKKHLADKDTTMTLEDEYGKEYKMKYIACKTGLSAGWRQFSAVHKLQEGDVLVFQLVEPAKFKIYIVRADNLREVDGALSLMNLDSYARQKQREKENPENDALDASITKRKPGKSVAIDVQKKKPSKPGHKSVQPAQSENDSEEALSEVFEGFRTLDFKDVKGFENFSIIVDGVVLDAEFSNEVRNKYYKLCYSQRAFLHDNLTRGLNYKLVVGIITETVNIADAIKVSVLATPRFDFSNWDKTLLAFEHMGMNVEFLRVKLRRLVSIAYETDDALETRRYFQYKNQHSRADAEIKNMESKLEDLKGACKDFSAYIKSLKQKAETHQNKFQKEVASPW